jgi:hypothetical protein
LIVTGLIATLKEAVIIMLGHAPVEALRGVTELTVAGVKSGLAAGLQHPEVKISSRKTGNHILRSLYLHMTIILFPLGFTDAAQ